MSIAVKIGLSNLYTLLQNFLRVVSPYQAIPYFSKLLYLSVPCDGRPRSEVRSVNVKLNSGTLIFQILSKSVVRMHVQHPFLRAIYCWITVSRTCKFS